MKIVLSGVETKNKGAELMLYAILQEIARRHPGAIVYIPGDRLFHPIEYISTNVDFRKLPCYGMVKNLKLKRIYNYLHIPYRYLPYNIFTGKIDYYLDGSGFRFSDQMKLSTVSISVLESQLSYYHSNNTKIIYLPQAFGPFEKKNSLKVVSILNKYSSLVFPREKVSYNYLANTKLMDMKKVNVFTDFTSLVDGQFPQKYEYLRNGICIIPNMRMIDMGVTTKDDYIEFLKAIIDEGKKSSRPIYLLNHEGKQDELLCYQCQKIIGGDVEVVNGLNALETKGLISSAYLVITSRYHGLASALSSNVPCLATSWSHKYGELFKDYELENYVLSLNNIHAAVNTVKLLLNEQENQHIRSRLSDILPKIKEQANAMWNLVWDF